MKLRCTENSIRIRVRKSDIERLAKEKMIRESVRLGAGAGFDFALTISDQAERVDANFEGQELSVVLPQSQADQWIGSNQVGIEVNNPIDTEGSLHILVEKDFPCLDREDENKSDTFWELAPDHPENC